MKTTATRKVQMELRLAAIQDAISHVEAEHAALVAVAEAADHLNRLINLRGKNEAERIAICNFDQALASLAQVRGGKAVQS